LTRSLCDDFHNFGASFFIAAIAIHTRSTVVRELCTNGTGFLGERTQESGRIVDAVGLFFVGANRWRWRGRLRVKAVYSWLNRERIIDTGKFPIEKGHDYKL
jgi:hypothetical protein